MRNHDEKNKNMQRSVLPSSRRSAARRERRAIHQRTRARQRDALAQYRKDDDVPEPDFREGRRKAATKWMVVDRRSADKIGPLTRWAVRTIERDPTLRTAALADQVAYFASRLPADVIGRHAVFHIELALRWRFHSDSERRYWGPPPGPTRHERREQVAVDARWILETGRHRELNVALRRACAAGAPLAVRRWRAPEPAPIPVRLLVGVHDIDAFAHEISGHPWLCDTVAHVARRR